MISVVVPIFNEENNIAQLYKRLTEAAGQWKDSFEVIFVDDGSTDNSASLMKDIIDRDGRFKAITFSRNFGHQAAITAGIQRANGDAVVVMDGDLQDPPEEIAKFLDKWREGYGVVYAIRTKRKENLFKRCCYSLFYLILKAISEIEIPLDSGDFCVMDKKVVNVLKSEMPEQIRFVRGLRAFAGFKQVGIKYERSRREHGETKYTFSKLFKLAFDGIFDFSTFPLRLSIYSGFFVAIPSFLVGMFFIVNRIFDFKVLGHSPDDTPGIATVIVGVFFLGGIILISLGIIGEYVRRIYYEVKRRPSYIIDTVYTNDKQQNDGAS